MRSLLPFRRAGWPGLASGAILAAGTIAVYRRTFAVPLLFDDRGSITDNPSIRRLWPIWQVLSPPNSAGVRGRPLYNLSYALNYASGGTAVFGYHLVNLLIHVLAAWTLFALARRTLRRPLLASRFGPAATSLALAIAAIWTWHPLQTESVTYLSQRAESLMGLFYLLTLYCFGRAVDANDRGRRIWFSLSVLACLAGVATKEVIVTAPLMVFLYDRTFVSGSFSAAWRRHRSAHLALAATWIPLGCLMTGLGHLGVGFGSGVAWWAYGLTECRAMVKYLMLAFWPHPLVFDYGMYIAPRVSEIWPYALGVVSLLTAAALAWRRSPAFAFAACWFFLILAPVSSFVPVVTQPIAENRLYLPLAGVVAIAVLGSFAVAGRWSLPLVALVAVALAVASAQRNRDYSSAEAIWRDTIAKNPTNPRAHNNLGYELKDVPGRTAEAIAEYEEALRLNPDYADAHNNLGYVLENMPGRLNEAIDQYEAALRLEPARPELHYNLGNALKSEGRAREAIAQYEETLRLKPDFAEAHSNLGYVLENTRGRLNDAISQYEEAQRLKPDSAALQFNLAAALLKAPGRSREAEAHLEAGLRLQPENDLARQILAKLRASSP